MRSSEVPEHQAKYCRLKASIAADLFRMRTRLGAHARANRLLILSLRETVNFQPVEGSIKVWDGTNIASTLQVFIKLM